MPVTPRPLIPEATGGQTGAILGAMRAVAGTGGALSDADGMALAAADRFVFGHPEGTPIPDAVGPDALRAALAGSGLAGEAVKFLTVMAFVDGRLDKAKIGRVLEYAAALGVRDAYLDDVRLAAQDRVQEALAHMARANMQSITGRDWQGGDVDAWLMPYGGGKADPALAARFEALGRLDAASFGHVYWAHFKDNGYAFPGEPAGLNAAFAVPHDSAHVIAGYDTRPRGEILVSTFTAAMHPQFPMAGHILPVIFTWQLRMQINEVARHARGALDPREFWHAWAAGAAAKVDTFAPDWDFWAHVDQPLGALREEWNIPAGGLDHLP